MPASVVKIGVEYSPNVDEEPKLPSPYTPQDWIRYEWFKRGTEPTEVSTRFVRLVTPGNFSANYDPNTKNVYLSWSAVGQAFTPDASYGAFGYRIFKDGAQIDFTTGTSYTIANTTNQNGTYSVVAGYQNNNQNDSAPATAVINYVDTSMYGASLNVPSSMTYEVNDTIPEPSLEDITVTKYGKPVELLSGVQITIKNSSGATTNKVSSAAPDTFTVTYRINYENYSKTLSRTIVVKEKANSSP